MFEYLIKLSHTITAISVVCSFLCVIIYYARKSYKEGQKVYEQLIPNGGSSLADKINEIDRKLRGLSTQVLINRERQGMLWAIQNIPYFECNENGECVYTNDALNNLFNKSAQEMLGFGWTSAIATQHERERIRDSWITSVKENIPYDEVYRVRTKHNNEEFMVRAIAKHILDEKKN